MPDPSGFTKHEDHYPTPDYPFQGPATQGPATQGPAIDLAAHKQFGHFTEPIKIAESPLPAHALKQCNEIYFRQSLIKDYSNCPQQAMYRWIGGQEQDFAYFAAYLGTAGHEVIFKIHEERRYARTQAEVESMENQKWLMDTFENAFWKEVKVRDQQPRLSVHYNSVQEQLYAEMPWYMHILGSYQSHPQNHTFHSTIHEQSFVLIIPGRIYSDRQCTEEEVRSGGEAWKDYLFTGMIDQGGIYEDGTLALRDLKFRDNAFKPDRIQLDLDTQMTIYAAAMKYGWPACLKCKPVYEDQYDHTDGTTLQVLRYNGPCETCAAKIGTPKWPQKFVERCELVWMWDFEQHKKDQYEKVIIDNSGGPASKVPNPKGKGPKVYPRIFNPQWNDGYKMGDRKGKCFHRTYRSEAQMSVLMGDVLTLCDNIRKGVFFRRPSSNCRMCAHQQACNLSIKSAVQDIDFRNIKTFGTEDPF